MKNLIILGVLFIGLVGCTRVDPVTLPSDGVITCVHKTDSRENFAYEESKSKMFTSHKYNVDVFVIETVDGRELLVNSLEFENFECK